MPLTLDDVSKLTEEQARETLQRIRWPQGPVCPHCGSTGNTPRPEGQKHRPGVYKCNDCLEQVTVPVERVDAKSLHAAIRENVHVSARLMTDEWKSYRGIGKHFEGGHYRVNHSKGEYARGDVHTNTVEGYFALLKRGIQGSFHHVS